MPRRARKRNRLSTPRRTGTAVGGSSKLLLGGVTSFLPLNKKRSHSDRAESKELAHSGWNLTTTFDALDLTAIEFGSSESERMTSSVSLKELTLNFEVVNPFNIHAGALEKETPAYWRLTIFRWKPYAVGGSGPTAADVFSHVDKHVRDRNLDHLAMFNPRHTKDIDVLFDQAGSCPSRVITQDPARLSSLTKIAIPLSSVLTFKDEGSPAIGKNKIWMLFSSNDEGVPVPGFPQNNDPYLLFTSRVFFCDI